MLNITLNRIHANDVGCEIEVPQKVIALHVLCKVEVAHGDVRASGAEHHLAVSEARSADLSVIQGEREGRLIALVGERHKEFVSISEQHLIVTADGNSSFLQPSLEILCGIASEGFVELGLLEQRCAAGHIENRIPTVFGKVGQFLFCNGGVVGGHVDLITQNGRSVQHILQIAEGWFKELADTLTCKPEGVEKLIVGVRHVAIHQGSIVISLDHTEGGCVLALVECVEEAFAFLLEGHILRHELEILDAALGDDQLDVLDISRRGISCELAYLRDIVIKEPVMQVGIEGAGLEEAVAQKHHSVVVISVLKEHACIQQRLAVPDHIFDLGFFFLCSEVVSVRFLNADGICFEAADSVTDDEDGLLGELDDVLNATEGERDIRLPRGLVGSGIGREVAGAPRYHIGIERLCDKETFSITACARTSLVANVVDAVDIEAVGVEMLTDILTSEGGGNDLVASLI